MIYDMIPPVWPAQMEVKLFHDGRQWTEPGADGEVAPNTFIFFRKSGDSSSLMWNAELKGNKIRL